MECKKYFGIYIMLDFIFCCVFSAVEVVEHPQPFSNLQKDSKKKEAPCINFCSSFSFAIYSIKSIQKHSVRIST